MDRVVSVEAISRRSSFLAGGAIRPSCARVAMSSYCLDVGPVLATRGSLVPIVDVEGAPRFPGLPDRSTAERERCDDPRKAKSDGAK
jgi:hypothetical protein